MTSWRDGNSPLTVIGLIAVAVVAGCHRDDGAKSSSAAAPAVLPPPKVETKLVKTTVVDQAVEKSPAPVQAPLPEPIKTSANDNDGKPEPTATQSQRVAILTPGGPLLLDVSLSIDDRPHTAAFDELVSQALAAADTDKDKLSTWKELAANKDYLAMQPANKAPGNARQLKMWTEQYDRNRDGQIQPTEAMSWLGRDAGTSVRAFDVRSSRSYSSIPSATSRVWKMLSVDDDERLSRVEIERGPAVLASLDANDDGCVVPDEVTNLNEQLLSDDAQGSTFNQAANPYAAIYLEPPVEVDRLEYLLADLYSPRQVLRPSSFPALAEVFKPLDVNNNDWLEHEELSQIPTMKPHLKTSVEFYKADATHKIGPSLTVIEHIPEIKVIAQPAPGRVVFSLGAIRLDVSAHDLTLGKTPATPSAGSQIRLMVHDQCDALCEVLDSNADGRLGEREIAACAVRLSDFDADKDGQLANDELPYTMIVAFVRGEQPGQASFYRPISPITLRTVADSPAWFVHADFNGDGDVSRREFLGSTEQFSSLDANHDAYVSADEAKMPKSH